MKNKKQSERNSDSLMRDWTKEEVKEFKQIKGQIEKRLDEMETKKDTK
ncbi:MAG: hypothetical protein JAZ19_08725 [Candidatus Thiodiazotropha taylori]|nr:hypothetical protein [Candidatus Thiodiazotropha taylori]